MSTMTPNPSEAPAEHAKEPETHSERWAREDAAALAEILHDTWFPRHPMGGNEIYRDGDTKKNLAVFSNEAECNRAIECHNALAGIPAPESAIDQAREALKEALAYVEAVPQGWAWQAHRECLQHQLTAALSSLTPATDKQG